jgi:uncharacterized protein YgiM (DUF1202 family)
MKKLFVALFVTCFLAASAAASFAGHRGHYSGFHRGYPKGHARGWHLNHGRGYRHYDGRWVALGAGVATGLWFASVLYPPTPNRVVCASPSPVVVRRPSVIVYRSPEPVCRPLCPPPSTPPATGQVKVAVAELNMRGGPGLDHAVNARLSGGDVLEVLGTAPGWLYVRAPFDRYGWVMERYTAAMEKPLG